MKVVQCIPTRENQIFSGYFIDAVTLTVFPAEMIGRILQVELAYRGEMYR